jgi:beta-glucanase (GH16 family)
MVRRVSGIRRLIAGSAIAIMLASSMMAQSRSAHAADYLENPTCETNATGWTASSNATVSRAVEGADPTCQVTPTSSSGTKTITMTSSSSPSVVSDAGSTVHVAAQIRSSQSGKTQRVQLQEVASGGTVVQSSGFGSRTGTTFGWVGQEFQTQQDDSRIRVVFTGVDLTGTNYVRVKNATVTVTPLVAPLECEDIDYSDPVQGETSFTDDFNGEVVDSSRWRVRDNESLSFDKARILAANVTVHDGLLDIAGKRQTVGDRDWTTGYIDTIGKFSQQFGRWEMRAKVPTDGTRTRGIWPGFWLRGDNTTGEIDVMETWGSPATQSYNPSPSYSWTIWEDTNNSQGNRFTGWAHPQTHTPPIYEDFHVYAVNWSPECLTFSFDGNVIGTVQSDAAPWMATSLGGPFNIRLSLHIGSNYWGNPDDVNTKPLSNYLVDYVRVYTPLN